MSPDLLELRRQLHELAEKHGMYVEDYEEGRLVVLELHSVAIRKGPGSERFVRMVGFTPTTMLSMALAALRTLPSTGRS